MANQRFQDLSFDQIKENIKSFLASEYDSGFNYEGSGMSVLLDTMAWAAYYTSIYSNLASSENFLDTAQLRNTVIARAKELSYFPRQTKGATATVQIESQVPVVHTSGEQLYAVVPANSLFNGEGENAALTFVAAQEQLIPGVGQDQGGGVWHHYFNGPVQLKQGTPNSQLFVMNNPGTTRFIINDTNIDVDTLRVSVNGTVWENAQNVVGGDETAQIYFLQEVESNQVEIVFGENIVGKKPLAGDIVVASFLSSRGAEGNGASAFSILPTTLIIKDSSGNIETPTLSSADVDVLPVYDLAGKVIVADGGSDRESIESIKMIAPRFYSTQNRLVTEEDYRALLQANFGFIKSISVWGGEKNVPQVFGKVFVSPAKESGSLTPTEREDIIALLEKYSIVSITPELVDPEIIYVDTDAEVSYNHANLTTSIDSLKGAVATSIQNYLNDEVGGFKATLQFSKMLFAIDGADPSILNSFANIKLRRNITLPLSAKNLTVTWSDNAIKSFYSSQFNGGYYFKDDGLGNVDLYDPIGGITAKAVGKIDYAKSQLVFTERQYIPVTEISYIIVPENYNLNFVRNNVMNVGVINTTLKAVTR